MSAGAEYDILTAIHLDDLERVQEIHRKSPGSSQSFQERSPLRTAASLGRLEICRYLIEQHRVDVNDFEGGVGYPIIKEALSHPQVVRLLIENGADLKTRITWRGDRCQMGRSVTVPNIPGSPLESDSMTREARVGTRAPGFSLWAVSGPVTERRQISLDDYLDRWLVLLFYSRDFSLV